jgi:hypothetical protein
MIKRVLKQAINRTVRPVLDHGGLGDLVQAAMAPGLRELRAALQDVRAALQNAIDNSQEAQLLLRLHYEELAAKGTTGGHQPGLPDVGFRRFSQFEEDGLLLYLFAMIGPTNRQVVEICAGSGRECMAANLIINHGWRGFLFDGDEWNVQTMRAFYAGHRDTFLMPPACVQAWVETDNVNRLLDDLGVDAEPDLFSLDMDGVDYWIWKAIERIRPRVVLCETHNIIPLPLALTVPYQPGFRYQALPPEQHDFRSVSLAAMVKLMKTKGYRLIGAHRHGFNVFFMRNDVGLDWFPEVRPEVCHRNPWTQLGQKERWPVVREMPWVSV